MTLPPPDVQADGCAVAVPVCLVRDLTHETTVMAPAGAILAAIAIGIAPPARANLAGTRASGAVTPGRCRRYFWSGLTNLSNLELIQAAR